MVFHMVFPWVFPWVFPVGVSHIEGGESRSDAKEEEAPQG